MTVLAPVPNTLDLHSPALGPWFTDATVNLPLPAAGELAIDLTLNNVSWLPPAAGLLSFFMATNPRPQGIVDLRGPDGASAFADGSFVANFRLLSWVERRLDALAAGIPTAATPANAGVPTRPIVRSIAMEFTTPPADIAALTNLLPDQFEFPAGVSSDEDKAANLGLTWDGSTFGNGPAPMTDLLQPIELVANSGFFQELLQFQTSTNVRLWAFDHRGRPLDAGAVAAWWNFMATVLFANLWADSRTRTAPTTAGLTFHLVNAHEGPLTAPVSRLTGLTGTAVVQQANSATGVVVGFNSAPAVDNFPQPLAAVLPDGRYTNAATAWPVGTASIPLLTRDFARIGIMSAEHDLVGQKRTASAGASDAAERRARDQDRTSTGVRPARCNRGALLAGGEAVLGALATPAGGAGPSTLLASLVDRDAGPVAVNLPGGAAPADDPELTATALEGGGVADGSVALDQRVLVTAVMDPAFAGAWVRIWPLGFDPSAGEHIRLDGGAAPVDANGEARIVLPLPDGTVIDPLSGDDAPRLGVDVMVVTQNSQAIPNESTLFPDLRFDRPFPASTAGRVALGDAATPLLVCSTGVVQNAGLGNGTVPPGSEVVGLGTDPPQLIDRSTIPAAAFTGGTVVNLLAAGDLIELTEPAFQTQGMEPHSSGDSTGALAETGATVNEQDRQPFAPGGAWTAGFPLPGMERLEVVMVNLPNMATSNNGSAVVGSTPLLGALHETPLNRQGHPGCPAAPEVHGNGVLLRGSATVPAGEFVRDRTIGSTVDLVEDAWLNPIPEPANPAANSLWIAGLRTEAAGVAAELAIGLLTGIDGDGGPYPFDGVWDDVVGFLAGIIGAFPTPGGNPPISALRALDRRILTSSYGAREGATAMVAAIERAEDFIYVETPAFDDLSFGAAGDEVDMWQTLMDRMDANPSLHVAMCVPFHLLPGAPAPLQRARDLTIAAALTAMAQGTRASRFVSFSPSAGPARSLRVAGTTMVVDDAVAIVGTTHLWRRGLSFDSSYAVAVMDERQARGRSQEVAAFRAAIMAAQLGITANQLPLDPVDSIRAIGELVERGGLNRLAPDRVRPPDPALGTVDQAATDITESDIWNPDGSFAGATDPVAWLLGLQTGVYNDMFRP